MFLHTLCQINIIFAVIPYGSIFSVIKEKGLRIFHPSAISPGLYMYEDNPCKIRKWSICIHAGSQALPSSTLAPATLPEGDLELWSLFPVKKTGAIIQKILILNCKSEITNELNSQRIRNKPSRSDTDHVRRLVRKTACRKICNKSVNRHHLFWFTHAPDLLSTRKQYRPCACRQ